MPTLTPLDAFYVQQIHDTRRLNPRYWSVVVDGLVSHPTALTYDNLMQEPVERFPATLLCAGNRSGGRLWGTALWEGVPLAALLARVGVRREAQWAVCWCADGYSTALPLAALRGALLAHTMNGEALTPEHGFPARLVVPGLYGYKMPKWIQRIGLTAEPQGGFWEARGWSLDGEVQPVALIGDYAREGDRLRLEGTAFAGSAAVQRVELSLDGGAWMPARLGDVAPFCAAAWAAVWTPAAPGSCRVSVRAVDVRGRVQPDATVHSVTVTL